MRQEAGLNLLVLLLKMDKDPTIILSRSCWELLSNLKHVVFFLGKDPTMIWTWLLKLEWCRLGERKEPRNILDPCPYCFWVFLEVFPKRLNSSWGGWNQVTRQHKKDQWALDDVISHTDVLLSCGGLPVVALLQFYFIHFRWIFATILIW